MIGEKAVVAVVAEYFQVLAVLAATGWWHQGQAMVAKKVAVAVAATGMMAAVMCNNFKVAVVAAAMEAAPEQEEPILAQ
jgi:hypothetical protein